VTGSSQDREGALDIPRETGSLFTPATRTRLSGAWLRLWLFRSFCQIYPYIVPLAPTSKPWKEIVSRWYCASSTYDTYDTYDTYELDSKPILSRELPRGPTQSMSSKKHPISVGPLTASALSENLNNIFRRFISIEDAMLMFDKQTNRHRGE
ncbi:hypothetical protein L9F63_002134, partial [Diploptera punctata]